MNSILVVDDEADLVRTYERLLHRRGYRVVAAGASAHLAKPFATSAFTSLVEETLRRREAP